MDESRAAGRRVQLIVSVVLTTIAGAGFLTLAVAFDWSGWTRILYVGAGSSWLGLAAWHVRSLRRMPPNGPESYRPRHFWPEDE